VDGTLTGRLHGTIVGPTDFAMDCIISRSMAVSPQVHELQLYLIWFRIYLLMDCRYRKDHELCA